MRVHFRLVDAAEGEHGNIKAVDEKARRFVLSTDDFVAEEEGPNGVRELVIRFEYRAATLGDWPKQKRKGRKRPPQQKDLNEAATFALLDTNDLSLARWMKELAVTHVKADGTQADYCRLRSHLDRYSARNTYDYFIHKDLGGFLRRELDFYVKNEVMRLDDIEHESAPRVEEWLSQIKVIRAIAHKIINFLAHLEGFQKKLWLKKKFVVETSYCVAVQSIPKAFHAEIGANRAQHDEWVDLHGIDGFAGDLASPAYSNPVTSAFLEAHPTLTVDTRHFDGYFTEQLLEALGTDGSLDEMTDGVLFHSENLQALRLMERGYRGQVDCAYIDPPYNTDASPILYKNGYKESSWMSLLNDRLLISQSLMATDGVLIAAIDDEQQRELSFLLSATFDNRLLGTICVRANPSGRPTKSGYSVSHEYMLFAGRGTQSVIGRTPPSASQRARFSQRDGEGPFEWRNLRREGSNSDRRARPALYYPIYVRGNALRVPKMGWDEDDRQWNVHEPTASDEIAVWPINDDGKEKTWRWEWKTVISRTRALAVKPDRRGRPYVYVKRRPHKEGVVSVSSWFDAKYSATEHGTALLKELFGQSPFSYPKSIHAVSDGVYIGGGRRSAAVVLDYFAGSGTTGHAVINLNREQGGRRKFILVEMGEYFDTVLMPRLKKVAFAPEWKDGKPKRPATPSEVERSPRILKVVRLESYEDTLNNLVVRRPEQVQRLLDENTDGGPNRAREDYIIRYMLDVETGDSPSLLDLSAFLDPSAYCLKIKRPGSDESRDAAVDLVETFNWLLGLRVDRMSAARWYHAEFGDVGQNHMTATIALNEAPSGSWWFRTVEGVLSDDRRALVIWRNRPGGDEPDGIERDNAVLDEWFKQSGLNVRQADFDLIYANGDHNLDSLRKTDQTWTGQTIEDHFKRLMFENAEE